MRRTIGLLLASAGLAFLVAGCANQGSSAGAAAGGQGESVAASTGGEGMRDFNLRVKCPGVHELKMHGWSDQQIMQQLSVSADEIPACEQWVKSQPKGYVPPPPPGSPAAKAAAGAKPAASPAAAPSPAH
jgi:hypothetical protein